jgi:retinol-binding protein 3
VAEHHIETAEEREASRRAARAVNFGFEKAMRLPGNVGLLELNSFQAPEYAGEMAGAVMTFLANTDALIIDLRTSRGGSLDMVPYLASYFFGGEPFHLGDMYWRVENRAQQFWTVPYLPGGRYIDKDVYLLTSRNTFSAPEGLAAFLQHHKRATVVGEPTRGGTHPGMLIKVHTNFAVFVPLGKPVYPSGQPTLVFGRWLYPTQTADDEGRGLAPDIAAPAANALQVAHIDALTRAMARHPERKDELEAIITRLKK